MWDDISLFEKWAGQIFAKYFKRAAERNSDPAGGEAEILWPDWDAEQQFSRISWLTVSRTFPLNYSYVRVWVRRRGRERKAARRGALVERQHTQRVTLTKNYLHARKLCILRAATYSKPQIFVSQTVTWRTEVSDCASSKANHLQSTPVASHWIFTHSRQSFKNTPMMPTSFKLQHRLSARSLRAQTVTVPDGVTPWLPSLLFLPSRRGYYVIVFTGWAVVSMDSTLILGYIGVALN